jgi:hypothetical protein
MSTFVPRPCAPTSPRRCSGSSSGCPNLERALAIAIARLGERHPTTEFARQILAVLGR